MENEQDNFEEESEGGGLPQSDLLKSYLAFARRAIGRRRWVVALVFGPLAAATFAVVAIWPRTYHCESKLMAQRTEVLEGDRDVTSATLHAASDVILRHENLVVLAKQIDLVKNWEISRPPVAKLKDRVSELLRGRPSDDDRQNTMVNYLETRLGANATDTTLTIYSDWPEPKMAASIVSAAQEIFLESRHVAEISSIQEKITILDGHASKLRQEIDTMAEQLQRIREDRLAEVGKAAKDLDAAVAAPGATAAAPAPRRVARAVVEPDAELPRLKDELDTKKRTLSELEGDRKHRLLDARAHLAELQPKYTPAHPTVVLAEQYVESLSHKSQQAIALEADIESLSAEIKLRGEGVKPEPGGGGSGGGAPAAAAGMPGADLLPAKVMKLLDSGVGVDPAVNAQLQSAINKYAGLRDAIRTARIDLDTAQAAFNHR